MLGQETSVRGAGWRRSRLGSFLSMHSGDMAIQTLSSQESMGSANVAVKIGDLNNKLILLGDEINKII